MTRFKKGVVAFFYLTHFFKELDKLPAHPCSIPQDVNCGQLRKSNVINHPLVHLFYLVFLESWIIANVLANPDVDQADRDEILSLFILFRGVDHLHQVPHQLLDVLVPLLADQPRVVVAGKEEQRI